MPRNPDNEVVVALADHIETRRRQLYRNIKEFVAATGLTSQGLVPIRAGERRNYSEATIRGVTAALRWTPDSVDRILRGGEPVELVEDDAPPMLPAAEIAQMQATFAHTAAAVAQGVELLLEIRRFQRGVEVGMRDVVTRLDRIEKALVPAGTHPRRPERR